MKSDDPFAGIKQQLYQLVEERKLTYTELKQVIDAVAELTQEMYLIVPAKLQRLKIILGLTRQEDMWKIAYERKMHQLELRLQPHQLEIMRKVIVRGILGEK